MNIPNILSLFRLALVPAFIIVYFSQLAYSTIYAALIYALACFTDVLDGYIARKYHLTTNLGKILDPLGDKMMTLTVLVCIAVDKLIPLWVIVVFTLKELLMGLGGLILHKKMSELPSSNFLGKAATVIFFLVCTALMLFNNISQEMAGMMIGIAVGVMLIAFGGYLITFTKLVKKNGSDYPGMK